MNIKTRISMSSNNIDIIKKIIFLGHEMDIFATKFTLINFLKKIL